MSSIEIVKSLSPVLCSDVKKSQQNQEKILGNLENQTQGCWVRIKYATSVLCSPTSSSTFSSLVTICPARMSSTSASVLTCKQWNRFSRKLINFFPSQLDLDTARDSCGPTNSSKTKPCYLCGSDQPYNENVKVCHNLQR